ATAHRQVQSSNQSLVQRFEAQVDRHPNRLAVTCDDRQLTYRELDELSNQLAHYLMGRHSLQAEDICAILLDRSEWMCTAIFAVLKTAGAYLPIDPQYPEDRIAFMQEECQCKCCIDQDLINDFLSVRQQQPKHRPSLPVSSSQLAYVLFTSGSTGRPKGVLIEQKNVLSLLEAADQLGFDFTESDVWTLFHSYCFDFSVWEIYGALLHGGQLLIVPSETAKDPAAFWQLLLDKQVTVLNQTPSAFRHLTREALEQNTSSTTLRYVIFGGEALQPQQLQDWHQKYPQTELINMYGITETTVHVTFKKIGAEEIAAIVSNIGQAIPGWYGLLMDVDGRILPAGSTGELYVGGAGLARAYLNQAELTEERFIIPMWLAKNCIAQETGCVNCPMETSLTWGEWMTKSKFVDSELSWERFPRCCVPIRLWEKQWWWSVSKRGTINLWWPISWQSKNCQQIL
ncbi:MAG: AMP-binding protein, partial [Bacteroidota bacterium]